MQRQKLFRHSKQCSSENLLIWKKFWGLVALKRQLNFPQSDSEEYLDKFTLTVSPG